MVCKLCDKKAEGEAVKNENMSKNYYKIQKKKKKKYTYFL